MLKTTGHSNKFEMKKTWRTLMGMAVGLFYLILPILFKISTYDFIYRKSLQFCDNCEYKRNHSKFSQSFIEMSSYQQQIHCRQILLLSRNNDKQMQLIVSNERILSGFYLSFMYFCLVSVPKKLYGETWRSLFF